MSDLKERLASLPAEKRALLAYRLSQIHDSAGSDEADLPPLRADPEGRFEPFGLTPLQQAYLLGRTDAFELGGIASRGYFELECRDLDPERLTRLPGFMNSKPPAAMACVIDVDPDRVYPLSVIREIISSNGEPDTPGIVSAPTQTVADQSDTLTRATEYLSKTPGAVEGSNGDDSTYKVACVLVQDFGLSVSGALPLMLEWNERCKPPWDTAELQTKLENARRYAKEPRGLRLNKHIKGSVESKANSKGQSEWETPTPLADSNRPPFPMPQDDDHFCGFWEYCARVSTSIQTPKVR